MNLTALLISAALLSPPAVLIVEGEPAPYSGLLAPTARIDALMKKMSVCATVLDAERVAGEDLKKGLQQSKHKCSADMLELGALHAIEKAQLEAQVFQLKESLPAWWESPWVTIPLTAIAAFGVAKLLL